MEPQTTPVQTEPVNTTTVPQPNSKTAVYISSAIILLCIGFGAGLLTSQLLKEKEVVNQKAVEVPQTATTSYRDLLTFKSPTPGANFKVMEGPFFISWDLIDPTLLQTFNKEKTRISLSLISEDGKIVANHIGGLSPKIDAAGSLWDIESELNNGDFSSRPQGATSTVFSVETGKQYKIRATLAYEPESIGCVKDGPDSCNPVYSPADQALIDVANQYRSESEPITLDLTGWEEQTVSFDEASLSISKTNTSVRGTSNMKNVRLSIYKEDMATGRLDDQQSAEATVPVVSGKWSYTPRLSNGTYRFIATDPLTYGTFGGGTVSVNK